MDFEQVVKARFSVRAYKPRAIPETTLQQVLEAARLAPTADNRQPFRLVVIHTEGRQGELLRVYNHEWFVQAPLIIGMVAVPAEAWVRGDGRNYSEVDAAIAMDHLILAAASLGLGSHWISSFDVEAAREVLRLPEGVEPIAFTPLGYPDEQGGEKKRKALSELVRYEHW